ncbi:MAG: 50S ribosomal protein L13 [Nitrospinae bacterium]|nr:50S ribosomal protein L13 [Nitrospinota bacterium]
MKSTYFARKEDFTDADKKWHIVDATDVVLGKLAVKVANILRGKDKPTYTPHIDTGGHVIVINAAKVKFTGDKLNSKIYYHHTGYVGHMRSAKASEMIAKHPERVIEKAVFGMLPGNKLRAQFLRKLKVYAAGEHPHVAQQAHKMEI